MPSEADTPPEPAGAALGRYQLLARLASGGMGEIYLARLTGAGGFEKLIALKRLRPELLGSEAFEAMLLEEARIAGRLSHPNVCEVYELGKDGRETFIAMQYLDGVGLPDLLGQLGDLGGGERARVVIGIIAQAAAGLHHAHELRDGEGEPFHIVHRDVSPSNLFVTAEGVVKVLDFGIAKARGAAEHTAHGMIKGKYAYMSPEQVRGQPLDRRSDVFSLAVVTWEALSGQRLFRRDSDYLIAKAILEEPIPGLLTRCSALPPQLAAAVDGALALDRERRPPSARAFGEVLVAAVAELGGAATPSEVAELMQKRCGAQVDQRRAEYERASALDAAVTRARTPVTIAQRGPALAASAAPATATGARGSLAWLWAVGAAVAVGLGALLWWLWPVISGPPGAGPVAAPQPEQVRAQAVPDAAPPPVSAHDAAQAVEWDAGGAIEQPRATRASALRKAAPGLISIDSSPYATIYLDGERIGVTPLIDREVPPGTHRVRAELPDGRAQRFRLRVKSGQRTAGRQLTW